MDVHKSFIRTIVRGLSTSTTHFFNIPRREELDTLHGIKLSQNISIDSRNIRRIHLRAALSVNRLLRMLQLSVLIDTKLVLQCIH